jgi:hypothetical protein
MDNLAGQVRAGVSCMVPVRMVSRGKSSLINCLLQAISASYDSRGAVDQNAAPPEQMLEFGFDFLAHP